MTSMNESITIIVAAETQDEIARALEVLSRPIAGLILDGQTVYITKNDKDDETS